MADLSNVKTEDLQRELSKRAVDATKPPAPLEQPSFTDLREMVIAGINKAADERYQDDDFAHYVYEAAMTAVYGPDFFAWRNRQGW
jgi:hypothetical protein